MSIKLRISVSVPGLKNKILSAKFLANGKSLKMASSNDTTIIRVPEKTLDPIATVIKVEVKGKVKTKLSDVAKNESREPD